MSEETTMNIQDLFNERIKQNKRIEELSNRVDFLIDRNDKQKEVLDKIKEIISKIDFNDKNEWIPPKQLEPILELLEEIDGK